MKLLKNISILIVSSTVIYLLSIFVLLKVNYQGKPMLYPATHYIQPPGGQAWHMFNDFKGAENYDLIIMGSSHAYRGYDPRIFDSAGYSCYNLGSSNQSLQNTYVLAKHMLPDGWSGTVIIDIHEGVFTEEYIESTSNLIANAPWDIARDIAKTEWDLRCLNILTAKAYTGTDLTYEDDEYVTKGYCSKDEIQDGLISSWRPMWEGPKEEAKEYFEKLIKILGDKRIKYVLVQYPSPFKHEEYHQAFIKDVIGKSFKLYKPKPYFLDFSINHPLNGNHFYDTEHMNQAGVTIFNNLLIEKLKATGY